jgi:hypothetical protein
MAGVQERAGQARPSLTPAVRQLHSIPGISGIAGFTTYNERSGRRFLRSAHAARVECWSAQRALQGRGGGNQDEQIPFGRAEQPATDEITNQRAFHGAFGRGKGREEEIDDLLFATSDICRVLLIHHPWASCALSRRPKLRRKEKSASATRTLSPIPMSPTGPEQPLCPWVLRLGERT